MGVPMWGADEYVVKRAVVAVKKKRRRGLPVPVSSLPSDNMQRRIFQSSTYQLMNERSLSYLFFGGTHQSALLLYIGK